MKIISCVLLLFLTICGFGNNSINWKINLGDALSDGVSKITKDSTGNIYILGTYTGSITLGNTISSSTINRYEWFLAKISKDGNPIWCRFLNANSNRIIGGEALALRVVNGNLSFLISGYQNDDYVFVAKYDLDGNVIWNNKYSGSIARYADIDKIGNIYCYGNYITGSGETNDRILLRKFNYLDGNLDFYNLIINSVSNNFYGSGIKVNDSDFTIAGSFKYQVALTDNNPLTPDVTLNASNIADEDLFIARYKLNGDLIRAFKVSTKGNRLGYDLKIEQNNNYIYIQGSYNMPVFCNDTNYLLICDTLGNIVSEKYDKGKVCLDNYSKIITTSDKNIFYVLYSTAIFFDSRPQSGNSFLLKYNSALSTIDSIDFKLRPSLVKDILFDSLSNVLVCGVFSDSLKLFDNTNLIANSHSYDGYLINLSYINLATTLLNKVVSDKAIQIFPNPSTGIFNIISNENIELPIYTITGLQLKNILIQKGEQTINLTSLENGMYFLGNQKIIIQH